MLFSTLQFERLYQVVFLVFYSSTFIFVNILRASFSLSNPRRITLFQIWLISFNILLRSGIYFLFLEYVKFLRFFNRVVVKFLGFNRNRSNIVR